MWYKYKHTETGFTINTENKKTHRTDKYLQYLLKEISSCEKFNIMYYLSNEKYFIPIYRPINAHFLNVLIVIKMVHIIRVLFLVNRNILLFNSIN